MPLSGDPNYGLTCPSEVCSRSAVSLTPAADLSTTLADSLCPKEWNSNSANASWIYGNLRPARLVSSPLLTLVAGLKAFCGQPCGWVINQYKHSISFTSFAGDCFFLACPGCSPASVKTATGTARKNPGFHPPAKTSTSIAGDFPPSKLTERK